MRILWAAVSGSVLILLVLLFRGIFRKKVPKRAVVLLWLLVCVRLLVPMNVSGLVSLSLPARLAQYVNEAEESFQEDRAENRGNAANSENAANLETAGKPETAGKTNGVLEAAAVHQEEEDISIPAYILPAENAENPAEGKTAAGNENYNTAENVSPGNAAEINSAAENVSSGKTVERNEENGNSAEGLLRLLYPAGAVLTALAFLILYGIGFLRLRKSEAVPEEPVSAWKRSHPLRRSLRFRMLSGIESPLTYGIIRPVIVIPAGGFFDRDGWQYALEHEYRHIRNFDFLIKLIAAAAVCMHFWNPLVWLMYFMLNRDIEYACDEMVIGTLGEAEKGAYGRALLMMEEQRYSLTFLHAGFGKHPVRLRIEKLVKYRKASAAGIV
ncbi:MAG: M56 family metallopeptidase, partial [Lachnospiraceae bacterium]|nr:M56 family metallopeptidase [Lachnospiraceae bacterium]